MRKGFTKIPNSLLDMSLSMEAIGLYTWLSLQADANGEVKVSRALLCKLTGLSERQVRTALEKLVASKLVTKLTTKLPTKFATTLTISFLASCVDEKIVNDQVNVQVNDQVNVQVSRAYKNDNYNIMSLDKTKIDKDNSSLHSELEKPTSKFSKPSIDEIRAYCAEKGYQVDAERFWCFYESKGWMVGKNHMKSWKAACTTWNKSERTTNDTRLKDNSIEKFNTGFSW